MKQGTSRKERAMAALNPSSFRLDDRSLRDIYEDTMDFSREVIYTGGDAPQTWEPFFEAGLPYMDKLEELSLISGDKDCPPHLALFFSFLKLYQLLQDKFNALTREHLVFFYQNILKQHKNTLQGDKVYVFVELARQANHFHLKKGSRLSAGRDILKNEIFYITQKDVALNKASIAKTQALYNGKGPGESIYVYHDLPGLREQLDNGDKTEPTPDTQGWFPFGSPKLQQKTAEMGFGIRSPILWLQEGEREIEVSCALEDPEELMRINNLLDPSMWRIGYDTPDGTFIKPLAQLELRDDALVFKHLLSKLDPPLNPSNTTILPELKFWLAPGYSYDHYVILQQVVIKKVEIQVQVEGLENVQVHNDYGILDVTQAFHPFGFTPVTGSNVFIHALELASKNLNTVSIALQWKGLPYNFKAYYEGYLGQTNSLVEKNEDFKITLALRKNREWLRLDQEGSPFFDLFGQTIEIKIKPEGQEIGGTSTYPDDGMIRISLAQPHRAFGHSLYPSVYTKAIMAQVKLKDEPIPNPPYTPVVEGIKLDYKAHETLDFEKDCSQGPGFFHIEPFGKGEMKVNQPNFPLLSADYNAAGQLYLGLTQLDPPQQITLFFEVVAENVLEKPEIKMSYLNAQGWRVFSKSELLSDTTRNLTQTGIITLNIPADISMDTGRMPSGFYWIKLETPAFPERFDRILSMRTNAVMAELDTAHIAADHPVNQLAPHTLASFVGQNGQIKKVRQPYISFGGVPKETDKAFFTRVSERLAHKNRAVTAWDIERLVLGNFPEIYQVICCAGSDARNVATAGSFHVIVIPKVDQDNGGGIKRPLASAALLGSIKDFLAGRTSPHVNLTVGNPGYDVLQIAASVSFVDAVDVGYHLKLLDQELKRFLSPWAFEKDRELELGTGLYRSSIIKFIEFRPYVNFIAQLSIYKNSVLVKTDEVTSAAHTILISADRHNLKDVAHNRINCQTNQGIAQMIVDINFQVE